MGRPPRFGPGHRSPKPPIKPVPLGRLTYCRYSGNRKDERYCLNYWENRMASDILSHLDATGPDKTKQKDELFTDYAKP